MPTYEYRCTACGRDLEAVQSFTDTALTECPTCQGALRKVYGNVGVVFKGSGFYRNDSRQAAATAESGSSGKAESGRNGESGRKSESGGNGESTGKADSGGKAESGGKADSGGKSGSGGTSDGGGSPEKKAAPKVANNSARGSGSAA